MIVGIKGGLNMADVISNNEAERLASCFNNASFEASTEATLEYVYGAYGMAPSSAMTGISRHVLDNKLFYLGRCLENTGSYKQYKDIYVGKNGFEEVLLTKKSLYSGNINFRPIDKEEVYGRAGIESVDAEDLTIATEMALYGYTNDNSYDDIEFDDIDDITAATEAALYGYNDIAMEAIPKPTNELEKLDASTSPDMSNFGNAGAGGGSGGGGAEDITKSTSDALGDLGGDSGSDADTATDNLLGDLGGDGGEEGGDDDSPDMLDDNPDDDDEEDDGTAAKKRIRKNMVKLHTIIKDSLDAMNTFTPAYEIENSKKYYRIQNVFNTMDEILLRIITENINNLTVEDLMKKYTTLCNIYDLNTRAMHEFKNEYKALAEKHGRKSSSRKKSSTAESDGLQQ